MKDAICVLIAILSGAVVATAFYGYWIGAWIGLAFLAIGVRGSRSMVLALAGAYLGGLLFHFLALGWMRCALNNAEGLAASHYAAMGWALTAILVRGMRGVPMCIVFPLAWTLGTVIPMLILVALLGPPGYFYMNRIASTQLDVPMVQVADLAGMAGVESLIAAVAGAIVDRRLRPLAACALLLIAVSAYGHIRTGGMAETATIRAALFHKYTPPSVQTDADLFVWPEGDRWRQWSFEKWRRFASRLGGTVVVGASRSDGTQDFNTALVATSDCVRHVDKRFLVMGGETPSPVDWFTGQYAENDLFSVGKPSPPCEANGITLAVCICYEVTIPGLATNNTTVIVNPGSERRIACANGPTTMLNHARLRAIEARRPVLRSVLGGYTALIDGNGRILASTIEEPLVGAVALDSRFSFYGAAGDWITPLSAILLALLWFSRRRRS